MTPTFEVVAVIDEFRSFIWTERYSSEGDFELYVPANYLSISELQQGYYIWIKESKAMMIIEEVQITTDFEEGDYLTVSGRSLESILRRRIIWDQTTISGSLQNGVKKLLDDAILAPSNTARKIPLFKFKASTDTKITSLTIEKEFTGDELYEAIKVICDTYGLGFRVIFTDDEKFEFELYVGTDRSYNQFLNPYVIFSPSFENLINSGYDSDIRDMKTVTLVAGEGEGDARKKLAVEADEANPATGLGRYELFTDARDLSSEEDGQPLTDAQYNAKLKERGLEKLSEYSVTTTFEGQAETQNTFVYGKDFFIGDIVQIENEFGLAARVRIAELIRSYDDSGYSVYPTFEVMNEEEGEE